MTKLRHYDDLGTARFVTFSCYSSYSLLSDEEDFRIVLEEVDSTRNRFHFALHGFVLMPNHVHLVLHPKEEIKLGVVIGEIKSLSARRILARWKADGPIRLKELHAIRGGEQRLVFRQSKCYDHNCRSVETVIEKINYCHMNPVKAGLVADPADWRWSSYRSYAGLGDAVLDVDRAEL